MITLKDRIRDIIAEYYDEDDRETFVETIIEEIKDYFDRILD